MLTRDILLAHYTEYANQSDDWVENMEATKRSILKQIIKETQPSFTDSTLKIAVLGASDKRYLPIHRRIFEYVFHADVQMTTFDLDIYHLDHEMSVIEHDVTRPFPCTPYHFIMSHALLKFLNPEEQFLTVKNSFDALTANGLAAHILHTPEIDRTSELRIWQYRVDLATLTKKLSEASIPVKVLHFESDSRVDWLRSTTVLITMKD